MTRYTRSFATLLAFSLLLVCSGIAFAAVAELEAKPSQWREQEADAASFASDWLTDLDNREFVDAALAYLPLGDDADAAREFLRGLRDGVGNLRSRTYGGASVYAVATDDSECKVRILYITEFTEETVHETVEVLLRTEGEPGIIGYRMDPPQ